MMNVSHRVREVYIGIHMHGWACPIHTWCSKGIAMCFLWHKQKLIESLNGFHGLMTWKATLPRLMVQETIGSSERSVSFTWVLFHSIETTGSGSVLQETPWKSRNGEPKTDLRMRSTNPTVLMTAQNYVKFWDLRIPSVEHICSSSFHYRQCEVNGVCPCPPFAYFGHKRGLGLHLNNQKMGWKMDKAWIWRFACQQKIIESLDFGLWASCLLDTNICHMQPPNPNFA